MKYRVTVEGMSFEVEVLDLHARPVTALIDGERFEIWPEDSIEAQTAAGSQPSPSPAGGESAEIAP